MKKNYNNFYDNYKVYIVGFVLSIILTLIPFWIIMHSSASKSLIILTIIITSAAQIAIHLICFFYTKNKYYESWSIVALIFTTIIIAILIGGSIWIMLNLNHSMIT